MNIAKKQKILLLSGALGDGHKQAARAILEASQLYRPDVGVEVVDFMEWTHPRLHHVGKFCYIQWVKTFPSLYGYLFQKTRDDNSFSLLFKRFRSYSLERMSRLLNEVQPTVVVSTFPPAAAAMSLLKARNLTDAATVTVITDHTDHSYWLHPYTDQYIVGSDFVRQALIRQNIPDSKIAVTGIPIRLSYSQPYESDLLRAEYGFDRSLPTVLVMGGGLGMIGKEFISMLQRDKDLPTAQFIIICGHNEKLKQQLREELVNSRHRIHITGYIDNVHEFMALSDLILTKPGGLTTSEALALELPMLLFKPLPGQERDNAAYLVQMGVAQEADNAEQLRKWLHQVFQNRELLFKMKEKAKGCKLTTSTEHALHMILKAQNQSVPVWGNSRQAIYAKA